MFEGLISLAERLELQGRGEAEDEKTCARGSVGGSNPALEERACQSKPPAYFKNSTQNKQTHTSLSSNLPFVVSNVSSVVPSSNSMTGRESPKYAK